MLYMKITNENLVVQLQLRNEKAMDFLVNEYSIYLISIIRKHLFTLPHLQMECMVETLLTIWKHIDAYEKSNEFENWMGSVTRYCCLEFLKKHQQEATIAWLIEKEIAEEREVMINSLEEEQQELFYRFYVGETLKKGSKEYQKYLYHDMYELLNEIDTDICEYEKEPLTEAEQEQILRKIQSYIGKKRRVFWKKSIDSLLHFGERKQVVI